MLEEKLGCEGIVLQQNNGFVQEIKHYHLHLKPYYKNKISIEMPSKTSVSKIKEALTENDISLDNIEELKNYKQNILQTHNLSNHKKIRQTQTKEHSTKYLKTVYQYSSKLSSKPKKVLEDFWEQ